MSLPGDGNVTIIIKKRKKGDAGHHGGAWKVAYADFVTAMMAFFLLLWLLSVTTAEQKRGIADYFAPVSVSRSTSGSGGLLGGQAITAPGAMVSPTSPITPDLPVQGPPGLASEMKDEASDPAEPTFPEQKPGETKEEYLARLTQTVLKQQPGETRQEFQERIQGAGLEKLLAEAEGRKGGVSEAAVQQYLAEREGRQFQETADQIRQAIQAIPELQPLAQQVMLDQTPDGLRIQIVDQEKQAMFPGGSSQLYPQSKQILGQIAKAVARLPNKVSISGHTDANPFSRGDVRDNWELSSDRANAARRALVQGGLAENRILNVQGRADRDLLLPNEPASARNRRISIVVLRESRPPVATAAPAAPAPQPAAPAKAPPPPLPR